MTLDPMSRMIRIVLAEKGLPARLVELRPWEENSEFASINPAGDIPVLIDEPPTGGELSISPTTAIIEYLEEVYPSTKLHPSTAAGRAEVRRLVMWIAVKFEREVIDLTMRERVDKKLMRLGPADYDRLNQGAKALDWHLDYFDWLLEQRQWLAGEVYSFADAAAAASLSSLDYISAIDWQKCSALHEWYARMKSRPSMRPLLKDRVDGVTPPNHFDDPDF